MKLVETRGRTAPRLELRSPSPDYQLRIGDYRGISSCDSEDEVIDDGAVGLRRTVFDRHPPPRAGRSAGDPDRGHTPSLVDR